MHCKVKVLDVQTISEIDGAWNEKDYLELLDRFNFSGAEEIAADELKEMLFMAINDFEPDEAAEIVLTYKLSNSLNKGQLKNLAHEMIDDSVTEEFADISLHFQLFNINRLLYEAYNGKFPNTKASVIKFEIKFPQNQNVKITKEIVLKSISCGLSEKNLIIRLFEEQLSGKVKFLEAEHIVWEIEKLEDGTIVIITSDYWINEEDFTNFEFDGTISEFEDKED